MKDRIEELFQQVMNEACPDPLRRFAELVAKDAVAKEREWVGLTLADIPETYAGDKSFLNIARWADAKLKEKNI